MHDLRVEARFKNAVLYNAITEVLGEKWTMRAAAAYCEVTYSLFCDLLLLREGPTRKVSGNGASSERTWRNTAVKIAAALCQPPEVLFPHSLYALALPDVVVREYESEQVLSLQEASRKRLLPAVLPDFESDIMRSETTQAMKDTLRTLSPRSEKILKMRFGIGCSHEHTLEEIAQEFDVTRERIRQIEAKAMRDMRLPERTKRIRPYLQK